MAEGPSIVVLLSFTLFVAEIQGAAIHINNDVLSNNPSKLVYHPNMTSMWVLDDHGLFREAFLHERPHKDKLNSSDVTVNFFLYTVESPGPYQLVAGDAAKLSSSTFDASRPTKILIHGFWNNYLSDAVQVIKEAYLNYRNVNVIAVDWSKDAAGPWYTKAVSSTRPVGVEVAALIDFIVTTVHADINLFHLIGHSLGAHVAGFSANFVVSGRITRITGNDPALPLYHNRDPSLRLDPTDADVVDCIHSCGGYLGFFNPICTADFYPNGGLPSQPACHWDITGACSHSMSYKYYAVTVEKSFIAKSCVSLEEVSNKHCTGENNGTMGDPASQGLPGLYYLETDSKYPFALS